MKKYILPLIFILFLTFTLMGDCWVSGYDQRVKLTTDYTKVDSTLTNFPATAFFTSSQCEEIFVEFDADEDFDRGQFALGDDTLLYAEKELFDDSASLGIYHYKIPSTSSSAGTDVYFYYDNDHAHNTTYIGAINTTAGGHVWDDNFKFVCHMWDDTTSTVLDSTSNSNDGTKLSANNPGITGSGKVGRAQNFHNDHIYLTSAIDLDNDGTIEGIIRLDEKTADHLLAATDIGGASGHQWQLWFDNYASGDRFGVGIFNGGWNVRYGTTNPDVSTFYHLSFTYDLGTTTTKLYVNGVQEGADLSATMNNPASTPIIYIGEAESGAKDHDGIIDEVRVSTTNRSAAWLKATYNTLWDTFLTYGSEETSGAAEDNAVFFGMNF